MFYLTRCLVVLILTLATNVFANQCDGKNCVNANKEPTMPAELESHSLTEEQMAFLNRLKEESDKKMEEQRLAKAKYDKIFNACFLDRSSNVDMQVSSVERAVRETCKSIAEDPSWFESLQYD